MNRLATLLCLAACLLLASACSPPVREQAPGGTLRVTTLNIYHDKADWPKRLPLIVAGLRELQPDVLVCRSDHPIDAVEQIAATRLDDPVRIEKEGVSPPQNACAARELGLLDHAKNRS